MEIRITVDEELITQMVEELIAQKMVSEYGQISRDKSMGLRYGIDKAVQKYIYDHKESIIDRCVNRATAELIRKGLPKLLERGLEI